MWLVMRLVIREDGADVYREADTTERERQKER